LISKFNSASKITSLVQISNLCKKKQESGSNDSINIKSRSYNIKIILSLRNYTIGPNFRYVRQKQVGQVILKVSNVDQPISKVDSESEVTPLVQVQISPFVFKKKHTRN
jgi:hypothetical protein